MIENTREANVIVARCKKSKKTFGIRVEKHLDNIWHCNWAFKLTKKAAINEGYEDKIISGQITLDLEYPGCPYCGMEAWFSCGKCGKLTCHNGNEKKATCAWCGNSGTLQRTDRFDLQGGGY